MQNVFIGHESLDCNFEISRILLIIKAFIDQIQSSIEENRIKNYAAILYKRASNKGQSYYKRNP